MANDILPDESRRADLDPLVGSRVLTDVEAVPSNDLSNQRIRLIDKKYAIGLTQDEEAELDRLQRLSLEALNRDFPLPRLDPADLAAVRQILDAEDVGRR